MKAIILLILLPISVFSQIDYRSHPQTISNQDSIIRIDWLVSSPKVCQIGFNHLVNFLPMKNENPNTTVSVELYQKKKYNKKKKKLIRHFEFSVGEFANRIYTYDDLNLKRGNNVYFVFKLNPKGKDEQYVFNIYEEPRAAVKTVNVINDKGQKVSEIKTPPTIKYKYISSAKSRRNMRKPIGTEL